MLKVGDKVSGSLFKESYTVKKKLGEGGQGTVYLVENKDGLKKAVKWYNALQATETQRTNISKIIMMKPLPGEEGKRFLMPEDLITSDEDKDCFGYLMELIDTNRFAELGQVQAKLKPMPDFRTMCNISCKLATSYKALHLAGLCYNDISKGNFMFDPINGDVIICDNDNVRINNEKNISQVLGTIEFMAPEIIMGKDGPSTSTDLHSLAVLLFNFWLWHHPFHGIKEYNIRSWDLPAKIKIYGKEPVFIFDPQNRSNALPNDPEYAIVQRRWDICPNPIKYLFIRAFTEGLQNPYKRVQESEWQNVFEEVEESMIRCQNCKEEVFWWYGLDKVKCWNCGKDVNIPIRLIIKNAKGIKSLLLYPNTKLLEGHLNPFASPEEKKRELGVVVQNPNNPAQWGLRNLTDTAWEFKKGDGTINQVSPQKAIQFNPEYEITFREKENSKEKITGKFEI